MLECPLLSQLTLVYNYKILTKLPSLEVLHGTTKAKLMSPCLPLYTNHPLGKRLQRFTKTPPLTLITTTIFRKFAWNLYKAKGMSSFFHVYRPLPPSVYFLSRENEKCHRYNLLALFLVFFSGGNCFTRPFLPKVSSAFWSLLGQIFRFFHREEILEFRSIFWIFMRKILIFFSRVDFCFFFFSGTIFFLGLFSRFFSQPVWKLLGQNVENFLVFKFYFLA